MCKLRNLLGFFIFLRRGLYVTIRSIARTHPNMKQMYPSRRFIRNHLGRPIFKAEFLLNKYCTLGIFKRRISEIYYMYTYK